MQHKIVLSPSLSGVDYLKTLAGLGVDPKLTFGVRYFNKLEFARYLLQCSGVICPFDFITDVSLAGFLYKRTKEIEYFEDYSFEDVLDLIKSLAKLRECISSNEKEEIRKLLNVGTFKRKNSAVIQFYDLLTEFFENSYTIDEIGFIRYAIANASPISDAEFIRYEEFEYSNLEIELLNKAAGKDVIPTKLFNKDQPVISSYTKAYGQNSEIEDILAYIYKNNLKFDECVIAASDPKTYGKILTNYQAVLKFPLVVNSGHPVSETAPGRLFGSICAWIDSHYHLNYLRELVYSREFNIEAFKKDIDYNDGAANDINFDLVLSNYDAFSFDLIINTVGNLKLGVTDIDTNEIRIGNYKKLLDKHIKEDPNNSLYKRDLIVFEYVRKIADIFSKPLDEFLKNYLTQDVTDVAVEQNAFEKYVLAISMSKYHGIPFKEMVKFLKSVEVGYCKPQPGALFLTSISNSLSYLRKHLFIVGLDSKTFPGKVAEDPIILDQDYEQFGVFNASTRNINENKRQYHNLIALASSLGVDIHLSYAYYNSETVKEQNASSVLFETYKKENGDDKTVNDLNNEFTIKEQLKYRKVGFFDYDLFPLSLIGKKAKEGITIESNEIEPSIEKEIDAKSLISSRGLSASAIEKYAECQYKFFLSTLLHIDQEKETDIYEVIPASDLGSLVHELIESFSLTETKEEFKERAATKFVDYFVAHPTAVLQLGDVALLDFLSMMDNGYDMEEYEHSPSILKEEDIFAIHQPSGLKIHGFPDKIVRLSDGTYKVVDYKTAKSVKHNVNDAKSFVQGAVYAYVLENGKNKLNYYGNKQIKVSEVVFRYLRSKINVSSYDKEHNIQEYLDYLDELLLEIKKSLETGKFEKNGDCKSCFFKDVCGGSKS